MAGAETAQTTLIDQLAGLTDDQARSPSLLPGWSVGHVLSHIARNAQGQMRMIVAAGRGEVGVMYPGGREGRAADIEAGAGRPAAELVDDVRVTADDLVRAWSQLDDEAWQRIGSTVNGDLPVSSVPLSRWREVTVHHADLGPGVGAGYTWQVWPDEYVRLELARLTSLWATRKPMGLTTLPPAALAVSDHQRAAWLLGRTGIDGLPPAGLMG